MTFLRTPWLPFLCPILWLLFYLQVLRSGLPIHMFDIRAVRFKSSVVPKSTNSIWGPCRLLACRHFSPLRAFSWETSWFLRVLLFNLPATRRRWTKPHTCCPRRRAPQSAVLRCKACLRFHARLMRALPARQIVSVGIPLCLSFRLQAASPSPATTSSTCQFGSSWVQLKQNLAQVYRSSQASCFNGQALPLGPRCPRWTVPS